MLALGSVQMLVHRWLSALAGATADVLMPLVAGFVLTSEGIEHWLTSTDGMQKSINDCVEVFTVHDCLIAECMVLWQALLGLA